MRFIFVDKILEIEKGRRTLMIKNVSNSEDYFSLHFPDFPIMPGALMLEALEQASIIFISYSLDFNAYALLKRVSNAKFRRIVRPGDQMVMEIEMKSLDDDTATVAGKIMVDGQNTATMNLIFSLVKDKDTDMTVPMEKLKSLYDVLTQNVYSFLS